MFVHILYNFIGLAIAGLLTGVAIVMHNLYAARRATAAEIGRHERRFARLEGVRKALKERFELPRWALGLKDELLRDVRDNLRTADVAIRNARHRRARPTPTVQTTLDAVEALIGDGEHSLPNVIGSTEDGIQAAASDLSRFRGKLHKHLISVYGHGGGEELAAVNDIGKRADWNISGERSLKNPFSVLANIVAQAASLSVAVISIGNRKRWLNGLVSFRIDAAKIRLVAVYQTREILKQVHAFRSRRSAWSDRALTAIVTQKDGIISDAGLQRVRADIDRARGYAKNRSQETAELLELIVGAETMLMAYECAICDVIDPDGEAWGEYDRAQLRSAIDWRIDIKRTATRVA